MRREVLITICIIISIIAFSFTINAEEISSSSTIVKITSNENNYIVEETIILQDTSDEYIEVVGFWIQDGAQDITISVNTENIEYENSNNIYKTNLSEFEIKKNSQPTFKIIYKLNKETEYFQKEIIRNTSSFEVTLDDSKLYSSNNLITQTSISLYLIKPATTETTLSWYLVLAIALLLLLLVIASLNLIKKPKTEKIKRRTVDSEELLKTKKALLMNLLKDIEKQHRSKDISDDTYHKLKEHYKNEAVITMKKLEDTASKIK